MSDTPNAQGPQNLPELDSPQRFFDSGNVAGFLLLLTAIGLLIGLGIYLNVAIVHQSLVEQMAEAVRSSSAGSISPNDLLPYLAAERWVPAVFIFLLSAVCLILARSSFRSSGLLVSGVVPRKDRDLVDQAIRAGRSEPVDQYIRLASLSGIVGTFTKVGLTGLPLATIILVIIFSMLAFDLGGDDKAFGPFMDLAKLTLGAFIGSYVQRAVERTNQQSELTRAVRSIARLPSASGAAQSVSDM